MRSVNRQPTIYLGEKPVSVQVSFEHIRMSENALADVELIKPNDPSLLTRTEIREGYGTALNFFHCHGLKPWDAEDCEEARAISRVFKAAKEEEEEGNAAQ